MCTVAWERKKSVHRWIAILSPTILSLVFNQMRDDAEIALETPVFCLLPIPHTHTPLDPSVKSSFIKFGKVEANYKDKALCLILHLKCAVSPVCIFLTNALRSHNLCGLQWTYIFKIWTSLTEGCFQFQMLVCFVCVDCSRLRVSGLMCLWKINVNTASYVLKD